MTEGNKRQIKGRNEKERDFALEEPSAEAV